MKMKRKFSVVFSLVCAAMSGFADHIVRTAGSLLVTNDSEVITLSTVAKGQVGVPAGMPDPVFWLDVSDTNGWTIVNDGSGYLRVETVPSKGNSSRYATTAVSAENGDTWYGWQHNETTFFEPRKPYIIKDPDLLPGVALDFVAPGSNGYAPRIGLVFNKVSEYEGAAPTNAIFNIGTVIAVYGSHDGRGWFLGGGRSGGGATYEWNRLTTQQVLNGYDYTSAAIQGRSAINQAQTFGVLRHDGLPTSPANVGFNHSWEVLSWTMQTATAVATGIGLGDTRGTGWERTGQQRIAEMLIFDEVLPLETVEKIETYLNAKWFGRTLAGTGGKAEIGTLRSITTSSYSNADTGITTTVEVNEGESLTIGRIEGGRGLKSTIRKTGAGELALRETGDYGGRIALAGGTLSMPVKTIPASVGHIVTNCYYHADASAVDDVIVSVEDGVEYVLGWKNRTDGTYKGEAVMLAPIALSRRPRFNRDALGPGKHTVDLGAYGYDNGRYLSFTTNAAHGTSYPMEFAIDGIVTVVAVYGANGSGGNLFNRQPWSRGSLSNIDILRGWSNGGSMFNTAIFDQDRFLTASNAVVFADGIRRSPLEAFAKPGFQVLAVRNPSYGSVTRLGLGGLGSSNLGFGGFQLAEIYVFRRQLSDDEMNDLSAYLAYKWFGSELNGYAASGRRRKSPDIADLDVEAESAISVSAGQTVRVGRLKLDSPLAVRGGGVLEIETLDNAAGVGIAATGADIRLTGPYEPQSAAEIAPDPAFHLDPAQSVHFEINRVNGTNFVVRARDGAMRHELYAPTSVRRPWIDTSAISPSLPVLNFGAYSGSGCTMGFDRPIDAVRSVYVIWAPNDNNPTHYAFMFGSWDQMHGDPLRGVLYDYHCDLNTDADGVLRLFHGNGISSHVSSGEIYVDGVRTNRLFAPRAGEPRLIELHHTAPAHIASFANDRAMGSRNGGSMFGETLIYTRVLSEREKVATRNYLMKKWFGKTDGELAALPEAAAAEMGKLAGEGGFVKAGDNTVEVQDISSYTGTVTVAEGTLKISRPLPQAVPALVTDGLVFHVDANKGIELVEGTDNSVKKWNSVLNDGWCAIAAKELFDNHQYASYPTLKTGMHDNTPFVQMNHYYQYMVFYKDGVRSRIKDIKTVFWVVGTDDGTGATLGGGFLLGGGNAKDPDGGGSQWDWHRGGSNAGAYRNSFDDPLTCNSATAVVRDGKWYVDGENVDGYSAGLGSNRWHYITAVPAAVSATRPYPASADGFAFEGRLMERILAGQAEDVRHRAGGQSLAEVLIYNRTLSDGERTAVESYLSSKWGFTQAMPTNAVDLEIADGATVAGVGTGLYFASVSGAGTVDGDLTAGRLVADAAADSCPVVTGAFIPGEKLTVELRNLPDFTDGLKIKLLECGDFVLGENGCGIVYEGEVPADGADARLSFSNGALYLRFRRRGTRIIVR